MSGKVRRSVFHPRVAAAIGIVHLILFVFENDQDGTPLFPHTTGIEYIDVKYAHASTLLLVTMLS